MAAINNKTLTIFMYPWFAMGHFTHFILTANKFAERGHKIIIVVPPNAQSKLSSLNLHPNLIQFRSISIPHVPGLPSHVQTSADIPIHEQSLFLKALDLTRPVIEALLCEIKPDFIFYDWMHWIPDLASRVGIRSVYFSTISPAATGFLFAQGASIEELMNGPDGFPPRIKQSKHAAEEFRFFDIETGCGITMRQRLLSSICEADAIGFKTCKEIEGVYCEFLENKLKKPILLTGPVVLETQSLVLDENWANWLEKFSAKTVVYCAFGSEAILGKDQFQELVLGIELTGLPFLIALKPPFGVETIEEALPEGFKERIGERGIVHGGWVPQHLILKHPAVGCFLTHCGYGSMWEGLMSECQLVVLPHFGDQHVNAQLLSRDLKAGVEIEKGDEDGLFTKEGVRSAIMAAMGDESDIGKEVKAKHGELRRMLLGEGFEESYFDGFVEKLKILLD